MNDQVLLLASTLVLGLVLGVLAGRLLGKRSGQRSEAVRCAAKGHDPAEAIAPARTIRPAAPLEMHLVLNVLNRMTMALSRDEWTQDGMTWLSDYLAAAVRFQRSSEPMLDAIIAPVQSYFALSNWLSDRVDCTLELNIQGEVMSIHQASSAASALQALIRQLEGLPITGLRLDCRISAGSDGGQLLQIDARSELPRSHGRAPPRHWMADDAGVLQHHESKMV